MWSVLLESPKNQGAEVFRWSVPAMISANLGGSCEYTVVRLNAGCLRRAMLEFCWRVSVIIVQVREMSPICGGSSLSPGNQMRQNSM